MLERSNLEDREERRCNEVCENIERDRDRVFAWEIYRRTNCRLSQNDRNFYRFLYEIEIKKIKCNISCSKYCHI